MMRKSSSGRGFTLVELLVVMAIMAVLIGISVAGLGYAMRRSRNISRQAAMANLDRALEAYYSDFQYYPIDDDVQSIESLILGVAGEDYLMPYLEGSWDAPGGTEVYYNSHEVSDKAVAYVVCVSQEDALGDMDWVCSGPGIGLPNFPATRSLEDSCEGCGDLCEVYDNEDEGSFTTPCSTPAEEPEV